MKITSTKIDAVSMEVQKEAVTTTPAPVKYTKDYLLKQRVDIQTQLDQYIKSRQAELDEVDALLAECDSLGLITAAEAMEAQIVADKEKETIEPIETMQG